MALHDKSNIETRLSSIKVIHNKTMEGMNVYVLHAWHLIFKVRKALKAKHKTENSITVREFRKSEFVLFTSRSLFFLKFICLWKITCFVDFALGLVQPLRMILLETDGEDVKRIENWKTTKRRTTLELNKSDTQRNILSHFLPPQC